MFRVSEGPTLHRLDDGLDGDLHFVADAEHQGAGVFHAPLHVGHFEGGGDVVLAVGGVYRGGHEDFVLHAMNREDSVHLHLRLAFGRDLAIHAIGTEGDFGVFGALQNAGVHALIAGRAAALAAGGVDHEFAGGLAGLRVEAQRAALQVEARRGPCAAGCRG